MKSRVKDEALTNTASSIKSVQVSVLQSLKSQLNTLKEKEDLFALQLMLQYGLFKIGLERVGVILPIALFTIAF